MSTSQHFPREFRIPVSQELIRSIKDPHLPGITTLHAIVRVRDLPNGSIPDKINPRSHENIKRRGRIAEAIESSLEESPEEFHLLNRGCLILAKKAWYDNQNKTLHFIIESEDDHGMVDGATTDRVLAQLKKEVAAADFASLKEEEIPAHFKEAFIHIEIIAGDIESDLRIKLAGARNTSEQVKEFSLEDLKGNFEWLKHILEKSKFKGKVRYRENEPKPVDVRVVLALLTLFHPLWLKQNKDPIVAYTGKGAVLELYTDTNGWQEGFEKLAPVVVDILSLYDQIHVEFQNAYKEAYGADGSRAQLGKRKGVTFIKAKARELPLSGNRTKYVLPDGWLYPLLASFRMLLVWPKSGKGTVKWAKDPSEFFRNHGKDLVYVLVERNEELGRNPNATGKSKGVWLQLRDMVEKQVMKERLNQLEGS